MSKENNKDIAKTTATGIYGDNGLWVKEQEQQQQATQMVRTSRALDSNMQGRQLDLWDVLEPAEKPKDVKVTDSQMQVEGIPLDSNGWELFTTLQDLLHLHSQTTDQSRADYYRGELGKNGKLAVTTWDGNIDAPAAYIKTTLAELTKLRLCTERKPSKTDLMLTEELLQAYNMKPYNIRYTEYYTTDGKGKPTVGSITRTTKEALYKAAITKNNVERSTTKDGEKWSTKATAVEIWLKPLFFYNIDVNYNTRPKDYRQRVKAAYMELTGAKIMRKLPEYLYPFLEQLIDAQNYKNCTYHCKLTGKDGLYMKLNPTFVKSRQTPRLERQLKLFAAIAQKIGLLKEWKIESSKVSGIPIATFKVVGQTEWK